MQQRQGTPLTITKANLKDQRGNQTFWIKMDNGDDGGYTVKADTQDYFVIGTPVDYFKDDLVSQAGKPYTKFKRMDALQYQQQDQQAQQPVAQPQAKFDPMTGQPIAPPVPVQTFAQPPVPSSNVPASTKGLSAEAKKQKMISASVVMSLIKDFVVAGTINLLSPEFGQYYKVMNDTVQKEIDRIDKL